MLHASYAIWGVVMAIILIAIWTIKRKVGRRRIQRNGGFKGVQFSDSCQDHEIEHRALMFLMNQKTDSMLAALAHTITQERQKLGVVVRKPSLIEALDGFKNGATGGKDDCASTHDRILSLSSDWLTESKIARRLELTEAEVSLVMRMNAA